jgi:hypothetical protein
MLSCLVDSLRTLPLLSPREKAMFHGAFTLAYACFLRCAEFTWSTFDPSSTLCVGLVRWSTEFAEVRLPRSKTDPFGQGVDLVVPRTRSPVCPYAALHILCTGRPASAPLFGLGDGFTPFSRTRFLTVLRLLLTCLGLPATRSSAGRRPGPPSWEPPTRLSRPLAAGPPNASGATSTSLLLRRAACRRLSFSAPPCDRGGWVPRHPLDSRPPTWRPAHLPKTALAAQPLGLGVAGPGALEPRVTSPSCNQVVMPLTLTHRAAELTTDGPARFRLLALAPPRSRLKCSSVNPSKA